MEIRTSRPREIQEARIIPPPDRGRRSKKRIARPALGPRRLLGRLKMLGKISAFLLFVALLCTVYLFAFTSERFNLRTVTCYGCTKVDVRQLEKIIRKEFPANVLRIELSKLRHRLEKETWIRQVEILRALPSTLVIYVQERQPAAILELHGDLMVADKEGIILDRYNPGYGKLDMPVFKGFVGEDLESYRIHQQENSARIRQALTMLSAIESGCPAYAHNISEVDLSDPGNLKILLVDDTAEVYLGENDYQKRFCTLMNNLSQYQELKSQYGYIPLIDMRFDGQIVYRLGQSEAGLSDQPGR